MIRRWGSGWAKYTIYPQLSVTWELRVIRASSCVLYAVDGTNCLYRVWKPHKHRIACAWEISLDPLYVLSPTLSWSPSGIGRRRCWSALDASCLTEQVYNILRLYIRSTSSITMRSCLPKKVQALISCFLLFVHPYRSTQIGLDLLT